VNQNITHLTSTAGKDQFYPTPNKVIGKMLSGIDWSLVENVLEPSAGKGNLVSAAVKSKNNNCHRNQTINIDCIEIDPHLRAILKDNISRGFITENEKERYYELDKMYSPNRARAQQTEYESLRDKMYAFNNANIRVIHDDFLTYRGCRNYQLILMNPPFADGDLHLLKALEIQKNGGGIVCLLNAETIRNPYSRTRQILQQKLTEYGANIDYVEDAFRDAERKADVDVAIIRVTIPETQDLHSDIWERMEKAAESEPFEDNDVTDIVAGDWIEQMVTRYNVEVAASIELIKQYRALCPYISNDLDSEAKYSRAILTLTVGTDSNYSQTIDMDSYLQEVRAKYWQHLFRNEKFMGRMTSELRDRYVKKINEMANYDFTLFNIRTVMAEIGVQVAGGIKKAIIDLFDKLTAEHSYYPESKQNIHLYDGWKTNKAHKLGKKAIIPTNGMFSSYSWDRQTFEVNNAYSVLSDIEKVFDYLNGTMTNEHDVLERLKIANNNGQTRNIQLKYFRVDLYKKGTTHIKFDNIDLVDRMNIYCGKNKNWLPPNYGKTKYSDMDSEEQTVVDEFQGKKDYERIYVRADYFLAEPTRSVAMLEGQNG